MVRGTAGQRGRNIFIHPRNSSMRELSYGRIRLDGEEAQASFTNEGQETGLVCLEGECVISAGGESFTLGRDDALYVPKGISIRVQTTSAVDLVECSAPVEGDYPLQFVSGAAMRQDEKLHFVAGTASAHREINIMLGSNIHAGKLVVGVTRSLPGNWTSWPPHEHAAMLEEIYVFVDMPEPSFGLQLVYTDGITAAEVEVVRDGDAVLLPAGYHPNVAIPGAALNFVWIMAAHREVIDRKWGVVQVDSRYA
jgi:5-deoxy-glucuronate isomerase